MDTPRRSTPNDIRTRIAELIKQAESWDETADIERIQSFHEQASPIIAALDPHGGPHTRSYPSGLAYVWYNTSSTHFGARGTRGTRSEFASFFASLGFLKSLLCCGYVATPPDPKNRYSSTSSPFFDPATDYEQDETSVFVIMPFSENWSERLWNRHIKVYVQKAVPDARCFRADDLFGHDVMKDIFRSIVTASVVIAEVTGRNPNVYYELGMCHCLGKPTLLLTQDGEDIPFDLLRFRHCIYEDNSDGYAKLRMFLQHSLTELVNRGHP